MPARVSDLTVDEFRDLLYDTVRDLVEEVVEEKLGMLADPDANLELLPEVAESLRNYLTSGRRGDDADQVFRSLGLS
jgi:hypothetical protein